MNPLNSLTKRHISFLTSLSLFLFLLISIPVTIELLNHPKEVIKPHAQDSSQSDLKKNETAFPSNELLIKVTKEAKTKIKENKDDTGLDSLTKILKIHKVRDFKQIVKEGAGSVKGHELFRWYIITLDAPKIRINGSLEIINKTTNRSFNDNPYINPFFQHGLEPLIANLKLDNNIESIIPNYELTTQNIPNDPYYSSLGAWGQNWDDLWGLKKINAANGWDQATGSANLIVAVIDTGVDRSHPDLSSNMWVNTKEIPGNGIDDDGNGYIDDYYGWNFVSNNNDPMDDFGHGTHCAGTIGAVGNNSLGVPGINWQVKIMALKFLNSSGSGSLDNAIKALHYAADMGASVSSNSWGGGGSYKPLEDALKYEHDKGMVIVAAAGNNNGDALDFNPANSQYAITVSATNHLDNKAAFSNWGGKIDVGAPGGDSAGWGGINDYILSLRDTGSNPMCPAASTIGTNYCIARGTSMAAPHVAGLAALLLSKNSALTNEEVRQILRAGADDIGAPGKDLNFGYGRINANSALNLTSNPPLAPFITSPASKSELQSATIPVIGSVNGNNFSRYTVEIGLGRSPAQWSLLNESTVPVDNNKLADIDVTKLPDGLYTLRLTGYSSDGKSYQIEVFDLAVANFDLNITYPNSLVPVGNINIIGTALVKNAMQFSRYDIEWGLGTSPISYQLIKSGQFPITNGILGTWDTSSLTDNIKYTLRLTVTATNGITKTINIPFTADKQLINGWPKFYPVNNGYMDESPVFADINGDGKKEIIFGSVDGKIYAYNKDGSDVPGFPASFDQNAQFYKSLNVDDLDGDGKMEIIAAEAMPLTNSVKYLIINGQGKIYPGWVTPGLANTVKYYSFLTPAVGDIDNDGQKEIVTIEPSILNASLDKAFLWVFQLNGSDKPGFPKTITLPTSYAYHYGAVSLFDANNDGNLEIAWSYDQSLFLFDHLGNIMPGWPYSSPILASGRQLFFGNTPALADVNGDNLKEIIVQSTMSCSYNTNGYSLYCYIGGAESGVYAFKPDGTIVSGWPITDVSDNIHTAVGNSLSGPLVFHNNNTDNILFNCASEGTFCLFGQNTLQKITAAINASSVLGDINGDGVLDIAGGFNYYTLSTPLSIFDITGRKIWSRDVFNPTRSNNPLGFENPPVIADIDNDGKMDMAAFYIDNYGDLSSQNLLFLWEIPNNGTTVADNWPLYGHDAQRTSSLMPVRGIIITPYPTSLPSPTSPPTPFPTLTPIPQPTASPTPPPSGDFTPPSLTISSPKNGTIITKKGSLKISLSASDPSGIFSLSAYLDSSSTPLLSCSKSPCSSSFPVNNIKPGLHSLKVVAVDNSPNKNSTTMTSFFTIK